MLTGIRRIAFFCSPHLPGIRQIVPDPSGSFLQSGAFDKAEPWRKADIPPDAQNLTISFQIQAIEKSKHCSYETPVQNWCLTPARNFNASAAFLLAAFTFVFGRFRVSLAVSVTLGARITAACRMASNTS